MFEGELLFISWSKFLHQIFSLQFSCIQDFIIIIRLLFLAAVSFDGLNYYTNFKFFLALTLLVANLANTKWCKKPEKRLKPWHMGTHLRVLSESYPINTNMTGSNCLGSKTHKTWTEWNFTYKSGIYWNMQAQWDVWRHFCLELKLNIFQLHGQV